jgi:[FeFe] hydrogenase H-cluster maturation GTPase HydF
MVVPIDLEAPAGRLILPQVQAIREALDSDAAILVVKDRELDWSLGLLNKTPDLVICDSQVVLKVAASVPAAIPLTTFSILLSRQKGDLATLVSAARTIPTLQDDDRVLVAETCTHKTLCDDIGRIKIPRWLRQYTGRNLQIEHCGGTLPADLSAYRLLIHCGSCMITRTMMLGRMAQANEANLAITNYGLAISECQGLLDRVIAPFPELR